MAGSTRTLMAAGLGAAAAVAFAAMVRGAGRLEVNGFHLWVLAPYVLLFLAFRGPLGRVSGGPAAGAVAAAAVLLATCWFYIDAMWFSRSSTAALVFVFVPPLLLAGALVLWAGARLLLRAGPARPADSSPSKASPP